MIAYKSSLANLSNTLMADDSGIVLVIGIAWKND